MMGNWSAELRNCLAESESSCPSAKDGDMKKSQGGIGVGDRRLKRTLGRGFERRNSLDALDGFVVGIHGGGRNLNWGWPPNVDSRQDDQSCRCQPQPREEGEGETRPCRCGRRREAREEGRFRRCGVESSRGAHTCSAERHSQALIQQLSSAQLSSGAAPPFDRRGRVDRSQP